MEPKTGSDTAQRGPTAKTSTPERSVQVHLRLRQQDAEALRILATDRDQTVSAAVRFLLRFHRQALLTASTRQTIKDRS
jgi:hypothetical protein